MAAAATLAAIMATGVKSTVLLEIMERILAGKADPVHAVHSRLHDFAAVTTMRRCGVRAVRARATHSRSSVWRGSLRDGGRETTQIIRAT